MRNLLPRQFEFNLTKVVSARENVNVCIMRMYIKISEKTEDHSAITRFTNPREGINLDPAIFLRDAFAKFRFVELLSTVVRIDNNHVRGAMEKRTAEAAVCAYVKCMCDRFRRKRVIDFQILPSLLQLKALLFNKIDWILIS